MDRGAKSIVTLWLALALAAVPGAFAGESGGAGACLRAYYARFTAILRVPESIYRKWFHRPDGLTHFGGKTHVAWVKQGENWGGILPMLGARVRDPQRVIELLGPESGDLVGIWKVGPGRYRFSDAKGLNTMAERYNAFLGEAGAENHFLIRFYEGRPSDRELLDRFVEKMEWPYVSEGEMALHDWTVHSLANLTDNEFLRHLRAQMAEVRSFLDFVESSPSLFPRLHDPTSHGPEFLKRLLAVATLYLDNGMGVVNFTTRTGAGDIYSVLRFRAAKTPRELLEYLVTVQAIKGSGPSWAEGAEEMKRAVALYGARHARGPASRFTVDADQMRKAIRGKLEAISEYPANQR